MLAYVYCHVPSRRAWAQNVRTPMTIEIVGKVVFLFDCPADYIPKDQAQFNKACAYFGFHCGPTFEWIPELQKF